MGDNMDSSPCPPDTADAPAPTGLPTTSPTNAPTAQVVANPPLATGGRPNSPARPASPYVAKALEAQRKVIEHSKSNTGWKPGVDGKTTNRGTKVFQKTVRGSKIPMLKGVCVIPNTPEEII